MDKRILMPIMALLLLASCKTTEQNYREAYEAAKQKERAGLDSEVYSKMQQEAMPKVVAVESQEVRMLTANVSVVQGLGETGRLQRYNVVTNQFKQLFNAKTMRQRLVGLGYNAFVVSTSDPLYYVVADSFTDQKEAEALLNTLSGDSRIILKLPFPFLLEATQKSK